MEITKELQQLAQFSESMFPVISVYLRTQWSDQARRAESTAFLEKHLRRAAALAVKTDAARQSLERDLARIAQWGTRLGGHADDVASDSVALFACAGADIWVEFPSPIPFENEVVVADRPALRQLARLDADYTNALVVQIDAQTARVCEVVLGGLRTDASFSRDDTALPNPEGRLRYRRQVQPQTYRHYEEVAAYVTDYCNERPETYVILSGKDEILAPFRRLLPPHVQHRIIDTVSLDRQATHERIVRVARRVLEQHERQEDQETVDLLFDSAPRGGLGVLGLADTLVAVNTGLVHKLVMHSDFHGRGWRCQECGYIGNATEVSRQCTACNGDVMPVELGEAMVSEVLRHGGLFEPVTPDVRLAAHNGVGALLRHL
jgi:Bacterial archaeo-eukaryotic release factor family 10